MSDNINFMTWFKDTISDMEKAGENYAERKSESWSLQKHEKSVFADLVNNSTAKTQGQREMEAYASPVYKQHIEGTKEAIRLETLAKVHYDALKDKFEAIRSMSSLEKAKITLV